MISSVGNVANPYNQLSRPNTQAAGRQGSAVATSEEAVLRAIDRVDQRAPWVGMGDAQRQDDRGTVEAQRSDIQESDWDPAEDAADLIAQKAALHANIAVLRTNDRMVGTLLDIFA